MKTLLLTLGLLPLTAFSQTKTTIANGDFFNPLIWDCTCLPTNGDSLIIAHDVTLNIDVAYTSGRIRITSNGSLTEDATDRAFWVDGTGSLINEGTFTSHLFLSSPNTTVDNYGYFEDMDSVLIQGTFINNGGISAYDVLNDEGSNFNQFNFMTINHDFNNQGYFHNGPGASLLVINNFSNCNLQSAYGYMKNDGVICISNDFSNCPGDTITGQGDYSIGGSSSNLGVLAGFITVYTQSGSLDFSGTIEPTVTVTMGTCNLGLSETNAPAISYYPNPVQDVVWLSIPDGDYVLVDLSGRVIQRGPFENGQIDLSTLQSGSYVLQVDDMKGIHILKTDK